MPSNRKRNQLGSVVLSFPASMEDTTPISWDEYKELTGVDLSSIFKIVTNLGYTSIRFRNDLSKVIYVKFPDSLTASYGMLPTIVPVATLSVVVAPQTADPHDTYIDIIINDNMGNASGYKVTVYGDKTIEINDDF